MHHIDIEKARKEMAKRDLDVLIAASAVNVHYCTGHYSGLQHHMGDQVRLAVIPIDSQPFVTCPAWEASFFEKSGVFEAFEFPEEVYFKYPPEADIYLKAQENVNDLEGLRDLDVSHRIMKSPILLAAKIINGRKLRRAKIGIDREYITAVVFEEVARAFHDSDIRDGTQIFADLRAIKSDEEIRDMVEAVRCTEQALEACAPLIKEGENLLEIKRKLFEVMSQKAGAEPGGGIAVGPLPPGDETASDKDQLRAGQVVKFDGGASYNHYGCDIGRSWAVGEILKQERELFSNIIEASDAMVEKLQPGTKVSDVYRVGNEIMRRVDSNYGRRVFMGHSHGLEIHEKPYISPTTEDLLMPGMVMCVEVPYYVPEGNSFQLEDEYLITTDGHKRLSERLPRALL